MSAPIRFTILHTNDTHSNLVGVAPASDYSPDVLGDDATLGGYARLATLIDQRRKEAAGRGPVLVLDAGDFTMQTAFGAAAPETGAELHLLARMGYDVTTFGNHEFDLGPDCLARAISTAAAAGRIPTIVASNTDFSASDQSLNALQRLGRDGTIVRSTVIERAGIRFGILGVLGKEAVFYTGNAGAVTFPDAIDTAKAVVEELRDTQGVDVVIALSHGGLVRNPDGTFTEGDDVTLAREVPGIDIVVGGHSHTTLRTPILVDGRPVVQSGKFTEHLAELEVSIDDGDLSVESYVLHPVDDTILGDPTIAADVEGYKDTVTQAVFASRGYDIDQPLVVVEEDVPNTFTDIVGSTPLANFVTDSARAATGADVAISASGMMRAPLVKGKTGVQTVYDVFSIAALGAGVVDPTAGSALLTAYFTGRELKNILEFFLVENPTHPGEYFPRASGLRFHYDRSRPQYDVVTAVELGDKTSGYHPIDLTDGHDTTYSVTTPLYLGIIIAAIPTYSKGALPLTPKDQDGKALTSRLEALDNPRHATPEVLAPRHVVDPNHLATTATADGVQEIKEWQAVMDHMRRLAAPSSGTIPSFPMDHEVRAIEAPAPDLDPSHEASR